jgi:hypothetical protein
VSRSRTIDLRWNALLNDFRRSGLTQAEFCRRRQISLHTFRKHLYHPLPSNPAPSDVRSSAGVDHHFLPVTILADPIPPITASQPHLELILSNGRRIAVTLGSTPRRSAISSLSWRNTHVRNERRGPR